MCKTIAIYQQTFVKQSTTNNEMVCKFQRIMKHNQNQFFIIKATITKTVSQDNGLIFMKNMPIINMKCNTMLGETLDCNYWYIGNLMAGLSNIYEMKVDDIPLDSFIIFNSDPSNTSKFVVNFQIELRE